MLDEGDSSWQYPLEAGNETILQNSLLVSVWELGAYCAPAPTGVTCRSAQACGNTEEGGPVHPFGWKPHISREVLGLFQACFCDQLLTPTVCRYSLGKTVLMAFSHPCAEMGSSLGDAGGLQESFWGGEPFITRGSWIFALVPAHTHWLLGQVHTKGIASDTAGNMLGRSRVRALHCVQPRLGSGGHWEGILQQPQWPFVVLGCPEALFHSGSLQLDHNRYRESQEVPLPLPGRPGQPQL